jgi:DNA polymerase-3 subunit epsilon
VVAQFEQLVDPREPISAEINKITGIDDSMVRGAPTFREYAARLADIFAGAQSCVAHNAPFDIAIIRGELVRMGPDEGIGFPAARIYCTAGLYVPEWGRMPRLIELYESKMGRPLAQKHRAMADVEAMVEIIQKERLWEILK